MSGSSGAHPPASTSGSTATNPTGTAGAGSTAAAATSGSTYRLDADDAKLTAHVGHKVEITGTLDKASTGATTTGSATSTTAGAAGSTASNAPKLKVDTVRMIASSCSQ